MKFPLCIVALTLVAASANATPISTGLFSLEVPDEWTIESNQTSTILVFGNKLVDGMRSPFLSIQYCSIGNPSKETGENACTRSCEEEAAALTDNLRKSFQTFPVAKTTRDDSTTELVAEMGPADTAIGLVGLLCSKRGQVHIGMVADVPRDLRSTQFSRILKSLTWK